MRIVCQCGKNYDVAEKFSGKVIRCRGCGVHLSVPENESASTNVAHQKPNALESRAGLSLPAAFGRVSSVTGPLANPAKADPVIPASPHLPAAGFLPVDMVPAASSYPPYSGPYGTPTYPYAGGPVGPRPKVVDLAAERRKKLEKVNLGVQLVYWSYAIVITSWLVVFVFLLTPLSQLIPVIHSLGTIAGLVLALIGYIFCINAPEESKGQPFIIAVLCIVGLAFLLALTYIGMMAIVAMSYSGPGPGLMVNSMALIPALLQIAEPIAFLLFLNRIYLYVENKVAAREAMTLVIFFAVLLPSIMTLITIAGIVAAMLSPKIGLIVIIIALALCIVASIATLARFLIFLQQFNASFQIRKPNTR